MIKIDKRYCIKFSFGGVLQYANFNEKDGVLIRPSFSPSWARRFDEIPDVSDMKTIDEVLEVIKSFSYCNRAEIHLINGQLPSYYNNTEAKELIESIKYNYDVFIKSQITEFFNSQLKPLLIENDWKISRSHVGYFILIEKDENGEWGNVIDRDAKTFEFEYLCAKCLVSLNLIEGIDIKRESFNYLHESHKLFSKVDDIEINEFLIEDVEQ